MERTRKSVEKTEKNTLLYKKQTENNTLFVYDAEANYNQLLLKSI